MRKFLAWLIGVAVLGGWAWLSAKGQYSWAEKVIQRKVGAGWTVAGTQANLVDMTSPWTVFRSPVTRIAFFRKDSVFRAPNGWVGAETLLVDYEQLSRTVEFKAWNLIDCTSNRSADIPDAKTLPPALEWHEYPTASPGSDINKSVCAFDEKRGQRN